jgi:signal transduction histidine kinase
MLRQGYRAPAQRFLIAAGFGVVMVIAVFSFWLSQRATGVNESIDHSLSVLNVIATLRADVRRAESGQRGYLLTADSAYLKDFEATRQRILPELAELSELTADNPEQKAIIGQIRQVLDDKLHELDATVGLQGEGRRDEALALVATDRGLKLMETLGGLYRNAIEIENRLLAARRIEGRRNEIALIVANVGGLLLIALLAYVSYVLFRRSALEILARERDLQELNAALEDRVAERTADLEAANTEIQRFAYVVTHDLRSPLVNIMGFTSELEVLRDKLFQRLDTDAVAEAGESSVASETPEALDPKVLRADFDEAIHFIKTSISKMDNLIKAILKISRAGRQELTFTRIDLNLLLQTMTADFEHRVRDLGAELNVGPLPVVRTDRMAIEQILSNLIDNALKYLRDGVPGRIEVRAEETPTEHRIIVADNGRGIAPADRERIFDLFRRAGVQDKPGEGIGLAHSRSLARRIGGTLRVDSPEHGGSTFTLTLSKLWMARQAAEERKRA